MIRPWPRPFLAGTAFAPVAAALQRACFLDDPWSDEALASLLALPTTRLLLAAEDEAPLGFVLLGLAGEEAEILSLGVLPDRRGQGLGAALVAEAARLAAEAGALALFLEVATDNAAARALYAAQGFAEVGIRPRYYRRADGAVDALVLRRALTPA